MLAIARRQHPALEYIEGDAQNLPFEDGSFDAVTIAFGLRNLADPLRGLNEMRRVLRPGGKAVVLEFVKPPHGPIGSTYRIYLRTVLPALGGALSGDRSAYRYLSDTVDSYRTPDQLKQMASEAEWQEVRLASLAAGTVGILSGSAKHDEQTGLVAST